MPNDLPPADVAAEASGAATQKGYQGKNMTLPASWWTSTSLFELERRAIFAKVLLHPLFNN